jgi:assimilatory nitrate reductase catalytic subunit
MDMGVRSGELARLTSRRGSIVLKARASADVRPGDAFVAMHWGSRFTSAEINALTVPACDPHSKQPELKHAAIRLEPFAANWRGTFSGAATPGLQRAAAEFLGRFDYAALSLVEGAEIVLCLDLAAVAPDQKALAALEELFGTPADTSARSADRAVCACFKVPASAIRSAVAAGSSFAKVQEELKCGTNCGSCVPELKRMLTPESV